MHPMQTGAASLAWRGSGRRRVFVEGRATAHLGTHRDSLGDRAPVRERLSLAGRLADDCLGVGRCLYCLHLIITSSATIPLGYQKTKPSGTSGERIPLYRT